MPNYNLSIKRNKEIPRIIEWNKLENYKDLNPKKLEDIDKFTGSFSEEEHLKYILRSNNLITEQELNGKFVITYKNNGVLKKLMYEPLYMDDLDFLNPTYIKGYIKNNMFDTIFLKKLCNKYYSFYGQASNINPIYNFINYFEMGKFDEQLDYDLINSIKYNIDSFVNMAVYNYKKGQRTINYRGLHDLAAFIVYQNRKQANEVIKNSTVVISKETQKPKVKVKEYKQITFEDMGW